ncbi:hypothetical protein JCM10207_002442 [Rhodosporidiobolus poonsookiae]
MSTSTTNPQPSTSSPSRPNKRRRTTPLADQVGGEPGSSGAASRRRLGSATAAAEASTGGDPEDSDREPSTDEGEPNNANDDDEPTTEEDRAVLHSLRPAGGGASGSAEAEVLDLTDEGDVFSSSPPRPREPPLARTAGTSLFGAPPLTLDDSDSDGEDAKPLSSLRKDKGKGKARASPSSPASPIVASSAAADAPAGPVGPDGAPLPTLNHLTCPICFGPPAPLALTSCGHAFCAPCLHASLVAGPALTPPPPAAAGRGRGRMRGGPLPEAMFGRGRGRGRGARGGGGGRTLGSGGAGDDDEESGDPELNKHCPVCRTALYGGWGKSLRGLVLRMGPAKRKTEDGAA